MLAVASSRWENDKQGFGTTGHWKRPVRKCVSKGQVYFLDLILFIAFSLVLHSPSGFLGFLKNGWRCGIYGVAICSVLSLPFGFISFPLPLFLFSSHPWKSDITQISISSSSGSETEHSESGMGTFPKFLLHRYWEALELGMGDEGAKGLAYWISCRMSQKLSQPGHLLPPDPVCIQLCTL